MEDWESVELLCLHFPPFWLLLRGTLDLQNEILANAVVPEDARVADYEAEWSSLHSTPLPQFPASAKQAVWNAPAIAADKTLILSSFSDSCHQTMLLLKATN